eukprot:Unigene10241_Nuclearia_a/m.31267 Unigene10241_Nuclearia_a/g.31267  ORF Unigene10241_Nuclearia_a/g.31267 Unigene10241_Nuclearia_a/m.31267 type:complete len:313 (-) Unigene10241_Nuclearia_a:1311-2249(-)
MAALARGRDGVHDLQQRLARPPAVRAQRDAHAVEEGEHVARLGLVVLGEREQTLAQAPVEHVDDVVRAVCEVIQQHGVVQPAAALGQLRRLFDDRFPERVALAQQRRKQFHDASLAHGPVRQHLAKQAPKLARLERELAHKGLGALAEHAACTVDHGVRREGNKVVEDLVRVTADKGARVAVNDVDHVQLLQLEAGATLRREDVGLDDGRVRDVQQALVQKREHHVHRIDLDVLEGRHILDRPFKLAAQQQHVKVPQRVGAAAVEVRRAVVDQQLLQVAQRVLGCAPGVADKVQVEPEVVLGRLHDLGHTLG